MATIDIETWKSLAEKMSENSLRLDIELTITKRIMNDTINKCERLSAENERLREKLDEAKKWIKTLEKLSDNQLAECVRLHETIANGVR